MSGWIQTAARTALAAAMTQFPECVVAVVIGDVSGSGFKGRAGEMATLTDNGEVGNDAGRVYVNPATFTKPNRGATITIGGVSAFVIETHPDSANGLLPIDYQLQRPVEGT